MDHENQHKENSLRKYDHKLVNLPIDRKGDCIGLVRLELEKNYEWAMELRKRVGLQALIWPFVVLGAAMTGQIVNLGGIDAVLNNSTGLFAAAILLISFVSLGVFYGFLERRLWERMQYLRRLFINIIAEISSDNPSNTLTFSCLAERDFKIFDMRGAYFIQYILVSCIATSTLVLIVLMVSPS